MKAWCARRRRAGPGPRRSQRDPITHVEPGVAPGLLDHADEIAGESFCLQLGRELEVERDHTVVPGERRGG